MDGFGCVLAKRGVGRVNGIVMFLISFEGTRAFEDIDGGGPCSAFKTLFHAAGFDIDGEGEDLDFLTFALQIGICGGQASFKHARICGKETLETPDGASHNRLDPLASSLKRRTRCTR